MNSYLNILKDILDNGYSKYPTRNIGNEGDVDGTLRTIGLPNVNWFHDMSDGYPLLTTKKMAFKTMCVELEGFIKGVTDKRWYQERGCRIWDEWYNPMMHLLIQDEFYDVEVDRKSITDLGPIYGYQWRTFNKTYELSQNEDDGDWNNYTDQLKYIVSTLDANPYDRRMVCSAWNPNQFNHMGLVPCHVLWNVTVYGNKLHLSWHQRSTDALLGAPFNIASYSLLLLLLCHQSGFEPGTISAKFMDCHLYENQIDAAKEQLSRDPHPLPTIKIPDRLKRGRKFNIFDWTHEDVELCNYKCHPSIKVDVVV